MPELLRATMAFFRSRLADLRQIASIAAFCHTISRASSACRMAGDSQGIHTGKRSQWSGFTPIPCSGSNDSTATALSAKLKCLRRIGPGK